MANGGVTISQYLDPVWREAFVHERDLWTF